MLSPSVLKAGGVALALSSLLAPAPAADTVMLLKDIVTSPEASTPQPLGANGGLLFFSVQSVSQGTELWRSDGTTEGTCLVKDIWPGPASSGPSQDNTSYKGRFFFSASDGPHGRELWASDGTEAGTLMVKDIAPGLKGSSPSNFFEFNGYLFFAADDGWNGSELWRTDGTSEGTVMVKDINPGSAGSGPDSFTSLNGLLYFAAADGQHGRELWRTDGTAEGTVLVCDILPGSGSGYPAGLTALNGILLFAASDGIHGTELWRSDGTEAGTVMVRDIYPGAMYSSPAYLCAAGDVVFFTAADPATGRELWKTDGTEAGTVLVGDLVPGNQGSYPRNLTALGDRVVFMSNATSSEYPLWVSDGTPGGMKVLMSSYRFEYFTLCGGVLYFSATDRDHGAELWKTDGTPEGTAMVRDIFPGSSGSILSKLMNVSGVLYFAAYGEDDAGWYSPGLWKSDGTAAGTVRVAIIRSRNNSAELRDFISLNGNALFLAGGTVWRSDGTAAGTVMVKDTFWDAEMLVKGGGLGFFTTDFEVWRTDGTEAGTFRVSSVSPDLVTDASDGLVFSTQWPEAIWKSDGTPQGTVQKVKLPMGYDVSALATVGQTIYWFIGEQLWKCDAATTGLVKDIWPGHYSTPTELTSFKGQLFFVAEEADYRKQLYRTDGTPEGTIRLTSGNVSFAPGFLTVVGDALFFFGSGPVRSVQLWKTDGTPTGTVPITTFPNVSVSSLSKSVSANGFLFFLLGGLWRSDGTAEGTIPLSLRLSSTDVQAAGDRVWYTTGSQLWCSDGTPEGTRRVVTPYEAWSFSDFTWTGSKIILTGYSARGTEVYTIMDAPVVTSITCADPNPARGTLLRWTVNFDQPVTGVDATDFMIGTDGAVSGAAVTAIEGSGTQYVVTVTCSGDGRVRLDLWDNDSIIGASGTPLAGPGPVSGDFTSAEIYTLDNTPPVVTSMTRAGAPSWGDFSQVEVAFSEPVLGLQATDLTVNGSPATELTGSGAGPYLFSGFAHPGDGALVIALESGAITDLAGNAYAGDTWTYEPPLITAWRSMRLHGGIRWLGIPLDPRVTDAPTIETRLGGIQVVEVDFNMPVVIATPTALRVTGWSTIGGVLQPPVDYAGQAVLNPLDDDTLVIAFTQALPDATCYEIDLAGAIQSAEGMPLRGITNCRLRALAGDVSGNGVLNLGDVQFAARKAAAAQPAETSPALDVNLDGMIDARDAASIRGLVVQPSPQALCP